MICCIWLVLPSCSDPDRTLFSTMTEGHTGIDFTNIVKENEQVNVLNYAYFYNGGGVAIGDINNDGLPDILFTGNMVANRLFLNKGNFKFEDITETSGIARLQGWCTGATMVDINGDGLLDIYICRSGDIDPAKRRNLLFINKGNLHFSEEAETYGLADEGYSTQAAFFDYDKDGDLDMVLINHSLQQYANAAFENAALREQKDPAFATKLYRNDHGHYTDVSTSAGIVSNVLSFGLGLAVSDINNDGWPDIYVSNDFNEPDHLYINNRNGTFTEDLKGCMDQTSLYSMGSDCADINNDGLPDLMTLDMLAEDNHTQKMHSGAENFDKFQLLFRQGFYYQYSRNMLQKNNGDGTFSEIGQLAGVSNTDWSWSALFSDLDNDGFKDLFVSNGYARDFTDMDFIRYHFSQSNHGTRREQGPAAGNSGAIMDLLTKMPALTPPDYIYHNNGDNTFTKVTTEWGLGEKKISSGAAYADLDNDGAMDLIVSRVNDLAGVYKNNAARLLPDNNYIRFRLQGSPQNTGGIGSKVKVYCKGNMYYQEEMPVRGFQSSVDPVLTIGIGKAAIADSVVVIWPDDKMQTLRAVKGGQTLVLKWTAADRIWDYTTHAPAASAPSATSAPSDATYLTETSSPAFTHHENSFNDFALQPLLPNYLSRPGPCLARADIDHDGLEDLFFGGAAGQPGQIFLQQKDGSFRSKPQKALAANAASEVASAVFFDADGDGDQDLYVASGGYELKENALALRDHLYLNDGKGGFTESPIPLPDLRFPKSCVRAADLNGDGAPDLFIGGRVVPGKYPLAPGSRILLNDGKGRFRDATSEIAPMLTNIGMVTDAGWTDLDKDGDPDLVIVGEWMPVKICINDKGRLRDGSGEYIKFPSTGWWNTILAEDMDGDGYPDLVIGNAGTNTQFRASVKEPVTLYYKDFDGNGIIDPILCYYIGGQSYPAVSRDDLVSQLPLLKKKFLEYHSYADAGIKDIFTPEQLKDANILTADCMNTVYLANNAGKQFLRKDLPAEAQYAPVYAIGAADIDGDGKKDLILAGNNSWTRIRFGRYKANHGVLLRGNGAGGFVYVPQWKSGLHIREDIRSLQQIRVGAHQQWIFGANDAPLLSYKIQ